MLGLQDLNFMMKKGNSCEYTYAYNLQDMFYIGCNLGYLCKLKRV